MKILLCDQLLKKVQNNRQDVLEEIAQFCRQYEANGYDIRKFARGYSVRKFEGLRHNKRIFKFRVNKGDRILFTFGRDVEGLRESFCQSIIFIDYCTHDEQEYIAKNKELTPQRMQLFAQQEEAVEMLMDERIEAEYGAYVYDPECVKTRVVELEQMAQLLEQEELGEYYLNHKQYDCVTKAYKPLFVFGSAGAGKTIVGIYKALVLQNSGLEVAYFTYSLNLVRNSERLFQALGGKREGIRFSVFNDALAEGCKQGDYVNFQDFRSWLEAHIFKSKWHYKNKYEPLDIWREIRGIIKGLIPLGIHEELSEQMIRRKMLTREEYVASCGRYSFYQEEEDRQAIYEIAQKYQKWLDQQRLMDDNDLARQMYGECMRSVTRYDYIIVDEAQDLTEVQLYLIFFLVKNPEHVFFTGDSNQTINPTYFNQGRIEAFYRLITNKQEMTVKNLTLNYRCSQNVVDLCNELTAFRVSKVGRYKANDYHEEGIMPYIHPPMILRHTVANQQALLGCALDRHYLAIVVPNEMERERLRPFVEQMDCIYTLDEIKGIEKDYIICFNMLSHYKKQWQEILETTLKCDSYYRIYFNMLYVAMSRAKKYLCFYEEASEELIGQIFKSQMIVHPEFSLTELKLDQVSTAEEVYKEALKEEKAGLYEKAILKYRKVATEAAKAGIKRCEAYLLVGAHRYMEAADLFFEARDYENAGIYYTKSKNYGRLLCCVIRLGYGYQEIMESFRTFEVNPLDLLEGQEDYEEYNVFYGLYLEFMELGNQEMMDYEREIQSRTKLLEEKVNQFKALRKGV